MFLLSARLPPPPLTLPDVIASSLGLGRTRQTHRVQWVPCSVRLPSLRAAVSVFSAFASWLVCQPVYRCSRILHCYQWWCCCYLNRRGAEGPFGVHGNSQVQVFAECGWRSDQLLTRLHSSTPALSGRPQSSDPSSPCLKSKCFEPGISPLLVLQDSPSPWCCCWCHFAGRAPSPKSNVPQSPLLHLPNSSSSFALCYGPCMLTRCWSPNYYRLVPCYSFSPCTPYSNHSLPIVLSSSLTFLSTPFLALLTGCSYTHRTLPDYALLLLRIHPLNVVPLAHTRFLFAWWSVCARKTAGAWGKELPLEAAISLSDFGTLASSKETAGSPGFAPSSAAAADRALAMTSFDLGQVPAKCP